MERNKWTFILLVALTISQLVSCDDTGAAKKCDENDMKTFCKGSNEECKDDANGPQCICKNGFKFDNSNPPACVAKKCDENDMKTFCKGSNEECKDDAANGPQCICKNGFKLDNSNPPACVGKKCDENDMKTFCKGSNEECKDDANGPQCICKNGFKFDNSNPPACVAKKCDENDMKTFCKGSKEECKDDANGPQCICKNGFKFDNSNPPACVAITCPLITAGSSNLESICTAAAQIKEECKVTCKEGHDLMDGTTKISGADGAIAICNSNGEWNKKLTCKVTGKCPAIEDKDGKKAVGKCLDAVPDEKCNVTCEEGYQLKKGTETVTGNNAEVTCQATEQWDVELKCEAITCPDMTKENIRGTVQGDCEGATKGKKCKVTCETGFDLKTGDTKHTDQTAEAECKPDGTWNVNLTCIESGCSEKEITDGDTCSEVKHDWTCKITCKNNFVKFDKNGKEVNGDVFIKCQKGKWDDEAVVCKAKCGGLKSENGLKLESAGCSGGPEGTTCSVSCIKGLQVEGAKELKTEIKCDKNGNWDSEPKCRVQTCADNTEKSDNTIVTWEKLCEERKKKCIVTGTPQCVCPSGTKDNGMGGCELRGCGDIVEGTQQTKEQECVDKGEKCVQLTDKVICTKTTCKEHQSTCKGKVNVCRETGNGPECDCAEGFVKKGTDACEAEKCDAPRKENGVEWEEHCRKTMNGICKPGNDTIATKCGCKEERKESNGRCIPKTCADSHGNDVAGEKWNAVCQKMPNKECKVQNKDPVCVCKKGYKEDTNDKTNCIEKTCDDEHDLSKVTFKIFCENMTNMECKNKDDKGAAKVPECVCKVGYKKDNEICTAQACGDQTPNGNTTISWDDKCKETNMKCVKQGNQHPTCVQNMCGDTDGDSTFAAACDKNNRTKCSEQENGKPKCVCIEKWKGEPDCDTPKECKDIKTGKVTWKTFCEGKRLNGTCENTVNGPECICKEGFKLTDKDQCEEIFCTDAAEPANGKYLEGSCKNKKPDKSCHVFCNHGHKLPDGSEEKITCKLNGTEAKWEPAELSCSEKIEPVCGKIESTETMTAEEDCINAKEDSKCKLKCAKGFWMVDKNGDALSENEVTLTCKKNQLSGWKVDVKCVAKCDLLMFSDGCLKFGASCVPDAKAERGFKCDCGSAYVNFEDERGCVFWESAVTLKLKGLDFGTTSYYSSYATGLNNEAIEEKLLPALKTIYTEGLEKVKVTNFKDNEKKTDCDLELFFSSPMNTETAKEKLEEHACEDECKFPGGVTIAANQLLAAEVERPKVICNENDKETNLCGKDSTCTPDPDNVLKFKCKCGNGYQPLAHFQSKDSGVLETQICRDIDECRTPGAEKVCNLTSTECQNRDGTYSCECRPKFKKHAEQSEESKKTECVDVCFGKPCGEFDCIPDENIVGFKCNCSETKKGMFCDEDIKAIEKDDKTRVLDSDEKLKKANTNTAVVGAVLGVLFFVVLIVAGVSIFKLRKRTKESSSSTDRLEMNRRMQ